MIGDIGRKRRRKRKEISSAEKVRENINLNFENFELITGFTVTYIINFLDS